MRRGLFFLRDILLEVLDKAQCNAYPLAATEVAPAKIFGKAEDSKTCTRLAA